MYYSIISIELLPLPKTYPTTPPSPSLLIHCWDTYQCRSKQQNKQFSKSIDLIDFDWHILGFKRWAQRDHWIAQG